MAASRAKTTPVAQPSKLEQSGWTPQTLDAAIAEAVIERGLSGGDAELFAQEAWAEMED